MVDSQVGQVTFLSASVVAVAVAPYRRHHHDGGFGDGGGDDVFFSSHHVCRRVSANVIVTATASVDVVDDDNVCLYLHVFVARDLARRTRQSVKEGTWNGYAIFESNSRGCDCGLLKLSALCCAPCLNL